MIITVWPGRVVCVWDEKGKLVAEVPLDERTAREIVRGLVTGWDGPPAASHVPYERRSPMEHERDMFD